MSEFSSPILQAAKDFWVNQYNVETNWYSFWIPLTFWTGTWLYAKLSKKNFSKMEKIHLIHHVGAITLASLSLYFNDDSIVNERTTILWTSTYFIIDTIESLLMGHIAYILHGSFVLVLGYGNYNIPLLRSLRMNSKAQYIETSSLVLPYVKRYRKPWLFLIFALVFTMCRIIWVPFMMKDLLNNGMEASHPIFICVGLFYCLNIHWYIKIIKIAVKGSGKKEDDEKKSETKSE